MNRSILDFFQKSSSSTNTSLSKDKPSVQKTLNGSLDGSSQQKATEKKAIVKSNATEIKTTSTKSVAQNRDSSGSSGKENAQSPLKVKSKGKSIGKPPPKRRRVVVDESESEKEESDYKPSESESSQSEEEEEEEVSEECSPSSDEENRTKSRKRPKVTVTPQSKKKVECATTPSGCNTSIRSTGTPSRVSSTTLNRLSTFGVTSEDSGVDAKTATEEHEDGAEAVVFEHINLPFLKPENRKDIKGRRSDHPDFDLRTLFVPDDFKNKCSPGMRQWWEIKSRHFDTLLFFKVGKFYELYHMDAVVAVEQLNVIYMRGSFAHSGFPEIAYTRMADQLVQKGYKVARVEQTETADSMAERTRGRPVKEKVVRREVCQITTPGIWTSSDRETGAGLAVLLAVKEMPLLGEEIGELAEKRVGVAFVNTSTGLMQLGQFLDDRQCSRLRTLIAHTSPTQVLYERGNLSASTLHILNTCLSSVPKESLIPKKQFWESGTTLTNIAEAAYFFDKISNKIVLPEELQNMLSETDTLGRTCKAEYDLAVSCLGAITFYLRYCLIDHEVMSMRQIREYRAVDAGILSQSQLLANENPTTEEFYNKQSHMVLDGITLVNLDILVNSSTETSEGTLFERLDTCVTPFGRRLLRQWMTAPLCHPDAISRRQDAVEALMNDFKSLADTAKEKMKKLPDLEKLITKIHILGFRRPESVDHPDSRAVLYEEATYSKRKISDFVATLLGFTDSSKILAQFQANEIESPFLKSIIHTKEDGGNCPQLKPLLDFFKNAFDQDKAKKEGVIIPEKGVDEDYDEAVEEIQSMEKELDVYLNDLSRQLSCKLSYFGTARNRYQIEVPESAIKRVPKSLEASSQRKGFKRYTSSVTQRCLATIMAAEDRKNAALKDTMRKIFATFDKNFGEWQRMVRCISELDCLIALAQYSRTCEGDMCRPLISHLKDGDKPYIEIREGRHPCLTRTYLGGDYIPNDVLIGRENVDQSESVVNGDASLVLVTGPNMGGKSTLMRQTALIVILAQMGCYVPATSCTLSPVDRVFTRLGATDRIMSGESTFYVELSETGSILSQASRHSLVLLDELGRGTATYDGCAIAFAVVKRLAETDGCRVLFSTHYHGLVEELGGHPGIRLGHMACMVENEGDSDDPSEETITFLYKFVTGACPKSYGFNAARLAHLPEQIIRTGLAKSKEFEDETLMLRFLRDLICDRLDMETATLWKQKLTSLHI